MSVWGRGTRISFPGVPEGGKSIQIVGLGIFGLEFRVGGGKSIARVIFLFKERIREM